MISSICQWLLKFASEIFEWSVEGFTLKPGHTELAGRCLFGRTAAARCVGLLVQGMQCINAFAKLSHRGPRGSLSTPLRAHEGIARVRQSIHHFIQIIFEPAGKVHGLDLQRQSRLPE